MREVVVGGCPSVTLSTTNPTWADKFVTQVTRHAKPTTDCTLFVKQHRPTRVSRRLCERWQQEMFHGDIQDGAEISIYQTAGWSQCNCRRLKAPKRNISLFTAPRSDMGPTQSIILMQFLPRCYSGWNVKLSNHRHLFPILRWRDALHAIPQMSLWGDA